MNPMRQPILTLQVFSYVFSTPGKMLRLAATLIAAMALMSHCDAGSKSRMVEVKDESTTYVGKLVAKDDQHCFLMDQFGELSHLPISGLQSFKVVGEIFRPSSIGEFRNQLQSEFRSGYEIQTSAHYIVVGSKGRAQAFSTLFEDIYRQVNSFYSIRGFETTEPETPLVAIVLATQSEFKEYCGRDQVAWSNELRGYYSLKTNRVAMYDNPDLLNSVTLAPPSKDNEDSIQTDATQPLPGEVSMAALLNSIAGETASTIIHETTHQVGYNIGIHSRVTETPVWVVEGLATVLESPGMRSRGKLNPGTKVNSVRLDWFNGEYESRRMPGDLAQLVASDEMFRNQALDAYSAAWAVTYFLTENPARARQFARYLKMLGERSPMLKYSPEERLKDFQSVFGDISRLEVDFLRSMDRIESP